MKSDSGKNKKNRDNADSSKKCYYDWLEKTEKKTFKAWLKNK